MIRAYQLIELASGNSTPVYLDLSPGKGLLQWWRKNGHPWHFARSDADKPNDWHFFKDKTTVTHWLVSCEPAKGACPKCFGRESRFVRCALVCTGCNAILGGF